MRAIRHFSVYVAKTSNNWYRCHDQLSCGIGTFLRVACVYLGEHATERRLRGWHSSNGGRCSGRAPVDSDTCRRGLVASSRITRARGYVSRPDRHQSDGVLPAVLAAWGRYLSGFVPIARSTTDRLAAALGAPHGASGGRVETAAPAEPLTRPDRRADRRN